MGKLECYITIFFCSKPFLQFILYLITLHSSFKASVFDLSRGVNPPLVPLNPQVYIDPHWFSQKYIKNFIPANISKLKSGRPILAAKGGQGVGFGEEDVPPPIESGGDVPLPRIFFRRIHSI